jgi:UDP-GlcNAc:undecaprenyl-phosphate GlcNAc-1-phosphate transferase
MFALSTVLLASVTAAGFIALIRPLAMKVGLVDLPDARKVHQGPVPLVGGLAIFVTVLVASLMSAWGGPTPQVLSFLAAGALLVIVGVIDDFVEISPRARFLAQAVAALVMIYGAGIQLSDLGAMTFSGATLDLGLLAVPFTIFTTIGVINALNMCDGLDGLSGSQALVSVAGFALATVFWGGPGSSALLAILGGGIVGFLLFNLRLPGRARASVFLGDAGSMFLGFALTWFAISLSQGPDPIIKPASALWFVMLPVIDAVAMMLRRMARGRSPFAPDREHLHHIFILAGYSVNQTVGIMAGLALAGVAIGLATIWWNVPDLVVAGAFLGAGLLYYWLIMHAWRAMRFLHRSICRRRSGVTDRRLLADRRHGPDPGYDGPDRRSGIDRRQAVSRRAQDVPRCRLPSAAQSEDVHAAGERIRHGAVPELVRRRSIQRSG